MYKLQNNTCSKIKSFGVSKCVNSMSIFVITYEIYRYVLLDKILHICHLVCFLKFIYDYMQINELGLSKVLKNIYYYYYYYYCYYYYYSNNYSIIILSQ